jgi:hypothetical protein
MFASDVTGPYCRIHQAWFIRSLQAWLACSPAPLALACSDTLRVVEAPCPRCLVRPQTAMDTPCPALDAPASVPGIPEVAETVCND